MNMSGMLTRMMGLGMPLESVMHGVTSLPAQVIGLNNWCRLDAIENATLFRIQECQETYSDTVGEERCFSKKIVPSGIILRGEYIDL
jgi:dihydroorotase